MYSMNFEIPCVTWLIRCTVTHMNELCHAHEEMCHAVNINAHVVMSKYDTYISWFLCVWVCVCVCVCVGYLMKNRSSFPAFCLDSHLLLRLLCPKIEVTESANFIKYLEYLILFQHAHFSWRLCSAIFDPESRRRRRDYECQSKQEWGQMTTYALVRSHVCVLFCFTISILGNHRVTIKGRLSFSFLNNPPPVSFFLSFMQLAGWSKKFACT